MKQTAVEQAKELVEHYAETIEPIEFGIILERNWISAKQCALIAVDLAINVVKRYETKKDRLLIDNINLLYWQEVKQEIENF